LLFEGYQIAYKILHRALIDQRRTNVYEREWDVLIVLDACRPDLLEGVASEYSFLDNRDTVLSVGSASREWLEKTFVDEYSDEIARTAYVTGNVKSNLALEGEKLHALDEVWKYSWDEEIGTILPRSITDRAISTWRDEHPERMIVHYMQPHFPSITQPELGSAQFRDLTGGDWKTVSIWDELRAGKQDFETVWAAYLDNLRVVLDDVELLLESIDADRVVLTADHGNAVGEWGFYDHPGYHPLPALREVPWVETNATATREYEPASYDRSVELDVDQVESRLRNLGYL
jgi:hypothetical protein